MKVGIVGVGLIGGSLGKALRRVRSGGRRRYTVAGWGRSRQKLKTAKRVGAVDQFSVDPKKALSSCDVVVLAIPVGQMGSIAKRIKPVLKKGAIVTDAGSVKESVARSMKGALRGRTDLSFVGAHPIAGSEKTGVVNARHDLFKKAPCVIATDGTNRSARKKVERLWRDAGAHLVRMKSKQHDQALALTSHLPHLLSFALYALFSQQVRTNKSISHLIGGSFRDMTRIAAADAGMWADILDHNRGSVRAHLKSFEHWARRLAKMKTGALKSSLEKISNKKRRATV